MPTDVGELVVRLTLDNGNFMAAIRNAESGVKTLETGFKATAAQTDGFGKGLDGLKNQASALTTQLNAQKQVVQLHAQNVQKNNVKLKEAETQHTKLGTALTQEKEKYAQLGQTLQTAYQEHKRQGGILKDAKSQYTNLGTAIEKNKSLLQEATTSFGENSEEVATLKGIIGSMETDYSRAGTKVAELSAQYKAHGREVKGIATEYKQSGEDIKKLDGQYKAQTKTVLNNANSVEKASQKYNAAKMSQNQLEKQLGQTNQKIKEQTNLWTVAMKNAESAGRAQEQAGKTLTKAVTLPLIGMATYAGKAAIEFESSFTGVKKTFRGTPGQLADVRQGIIDMANSIPHTTTELSNIAEMASQLGIEADNVLAFTRTVADLRASTNLGDEGAAQMARFANITGMTQNLFSNFGSTVVDLGNKFATTESEIVAMALRLAGAGKQIGMSEHQILAFATALSSVGLEAEAGGSAFSRVMVDMQLAVETGNKSLSDFAKVAGMTEKELQTLFKADSAAAIQAFIVGLSHMDEQGISAIKTLSDMGITQIRLRDTLLRATNANQLFSDTLSTSKTAWHENTALTKEATNRYDDFAEHAKVIGNRFTDVMRQVGEDFVMPGLENALTVADQFITKVNGMSTAERGFAKNAALAAGAIGPGLTILGKSNQYIEDGVAAFGNLAKVAADAGGGITGVGAAMSSLIGPAGYIALAAAGLYGLAQAYKYYRENEVTYANEARKAFERLDQDLIKERAERFRSMTVNAETQINVKTRVKQTTSDQISTIYQPIIDELEKGKEVNANLAVKVNAKVDQFIDGMIDGVKADAQAKLDKLELDFNAGSIDLTEFNTKTQAIIDETNKTVESLRMFKQQSSDTVKTFVGDASLTAGDATKALTGLSEGIGDVASSISGLDGQISLNNLFSKIATQLTDGKKDTKEQLAEMKNEINTEFDNLKADVEKKSKIELSKLDVESAGYDEAVKTIKDKNQALTDELNTLQEQAIEFVTNNSGRATSAVESDMEKLNAILAQVQTVSAAIDAVTSKQQGAKKELVKGGSVGDYRTIDEVFKAEQQEYQEKKKLAKDNYDKEMDALLAEYENNRTEAGRAHFESESKALMEKLNVTNKSIDEEYKRELSGLFEGITKYYPELEKQLQQAFTNNGNKGMLEGFRESFSMRNLSKEDITPEVADILGFTPESLWEAVEKAFNDPSGKEMHFLQGAISKKLGELELESGEILKGLDLGELGIQYDSLITGGLFDGLNGADAEKFTSDYMAKIGALTGELGQTDEPLEFPLLVAPTVEIAETKEGDQDIKGQMQSQVQEQMSSEKSEPMEVEVPVAPKPVVQTADGEEGGTRAALDAAVAEDLAASEAEPLPVDVYVAANVLMADGAVGAAQQAGVSLGTAVSGGTAEGIASGRGIVGAAAAGLAGAASAAAGSMRTAGFQIGRDFTSGIANGITAGTGAIIAAARAAAAAAGPAAKAALEEKSPSKVGIGIGKFFGKGIAIGISDTRKDIEAASKEIALAATKRVPNVLAMYDAVMSGSRQGDDYSDNSTTYNTTVNQTNHIAGGTGAGSSYEIDRQMQRQAERTASLVMGVGG